MLCFRSQVGQAYRVVVGTSNAVAELAEERWCRQARLTAPGCSLIQGEVGKQKVTESKELHEHYEVYYAESIGL